MAGAVAEELTLGCRSTGARGDFQQAIELARRYVLAGMSPLGIVDESVLAKDEFHKAQQELLREIEQSVQAYLTANLDTLKLIAAQLQQDERLSGARLREMLVEPIVAN